MNFIFEQSDIRYNFVNFLFFLLSRFKKLENFHALKAENSKLETNWSLD